MHKTITTLIAAMAIASMARAQDFSLPLTVSSGTLKTGVVAGIASQATNSFDKGLDVPNPFTQETLNAFFSHPEWNITSAGAQVSAFHRDIRGTLPQTFTLTVATTLSPVAVSWDRNALPKDVIAKISFANQTVDMKTAGSLSFIPGGATSQLSLQLEKADSIPPVAPSNLSFAIKGASLYLTWDANSESDLAGYKLHLLDEQGQTTRTLDLKNVTNYNLMNVVNDVPYKIAVSSYDTSGNESPCSSIVTAIKVATPPEAQATAASTSVQAAPTTAVVPSTPAATATPTVTTLPAATAPTVVTEAPPPSTAVAIADGDVDGDGTVGIADVLKVLRMVLQLDPVTIAAAAHADLDGDGKLTISDAHKILRKVVGLQ